MISIFQSTVSNEMVEFFIDVLAKCKNSNYLVNTNTCTVNGIQTENIVPGVSLKVIIDLKNIAYEYIGNIYRENLLYVDYEIDHMHIIEYNRGGYQTGHSHQQYEDFSFLIYLNSSDGDTILYEGPTPVTIQPIKNKIVFFNSSVFHESAPSYNNKKVVVGSVRFKQKIWRERRHNKLQDSL